MRWWIGALSVLWLSGCGDPEIEQLEATLAELRQAAHKPSWPSHAPTAREPGTGELSLTAPLPTYRYAANRSPFQTPGGTAEQLPSAVVDVIAPEISRPRAPLEHFALTELRLAGTLVMGEQRVALIQTPDGQVISAPVGTYVGGDKGRITQITRQDVRIAERTATAQGWQAHTVSLALDAPR